MIDRAGELVSSEPIVNVVYGFWLPPDPPPPPLIDDPKVFPILRKAWRFLRYTKIPPEKVPALRAELEILLPRFEQYREAAAVEVRQVIGLCMTAEAKGLGVAISGP